MTIKVLQWATGRVGMECVRAAISHPDLVLAGVGVYSEEKLNRDLGELVAIDSLSVDPPGITTVNVGDLVDIEADCVIHTPVGESRPHEAVEEICQLLGSGKNVCSTALMSLVHPQVMEPDHRERINAACDLGNSTFHATGINPGFFSDVVTMTLSGLCYEITRVHAIEIYSYEAHTSQTTIDLVKLGRPLEEARQPRKSSVGPGDSAIYILADALGFQVDEVRKEREHWAADSTFDITATQIQAGTLGAYRNIYRGFSNGREIVTFEFIGRAAPHCAPEWSAPARQGQHRWENRIYGKPDVVSSIEVGLDDTTGIAGATATGMRAVNAVVPVCAAPKGIVTMKDLKLITAPIK